MRLGQLAAYRRTVAVFLAECYWAGVTKADLAALDTRARAGRRVGYLGSLFLPEDEVVLCLFTAESGQEVSEACADADIPYERILEIVEVGSGSLTACQPRGRSGATQS